MPITATPPPPRKTAAPQPRKPAAGKLAEREQAIGGLGQIAQGALIAVRQYADAGAIGLHFPGIAHEVAKLADTDERIAKIVDPLLQVGPYAGLIAAVMPLVMQLAVNHGRGQAGIMGTVAPDALESQMKTAVMKAAVAAKREQRAAEAELKRLERELAADIMDNAA